MNEQIVVQTITPRRVEAVRVISENAQLVRQLVSDNALALIAKGQRGYSAYELAVQNGFNGTLADWLASLAATDAHNLLAEVVATGDIAAFDPVVSLGVTADSSNLAHRGKLLGIAQAAIASGFSGNLTTAGVITNPAWSWNVGAVIYLSMSTLSEIAPIVGAFSQQVGVAISATQIDVNIGPAVGL